MAMEIEISIKLSSSEIARLIKTVKPDITDDKYVEVEEYLSSIIPQLKEAVKDELKVLIMKEIYF